VDGGFLTSSLPADRPAIPFVMVTGNLERTPCRAGWLPDGFRRLVLKGRNPDPVAKDVCRPRDGGVQAWVGVVAMLPDVGAPSQQLVQQFSLSSQFRLRPRPAMVDAVPGQPLLVADSNVGRCKPCGEQLRPGRQVRPVRLRPVSPSPAGIGCPALIDLVNELSAGSLGNHGP